MLYLRFNYSTYFSDSKQSKKVIRFKESLLLMGKKILSLLG